MPPMSSTRNIHDRRLADAWDNLPAALAACMGLAAAFVHGPRLAQGCRSERERGTAGGVSDVGQLDGRVALITEYVEGELLSDVVEESGKLPPERAGYIAAQIAMALDAAQF